MQNTTKFEEWLRNHSAKGQENEIRIVELNRTEFLLGFYITSKPECDFRSDMKLIVKGVLCLPGHIPSHLKDYYAELSFNTVSKKAFLYDNYVSDNCLRLGIGSAGLTYIKDTLRKMDCKSISGVKQTSGNTKEELAVLTSFYAKNGFQNLENNRILFEF